MSELTGRQNIYPAYNSNLLFPPNYTLYRRIRKDATISFLRKLSVSAVVSAPWSVQPDEDVPEVVQELVNAEIYKWRDKIVDRAVKCSIDYGWACWEMVMDTSDGSNATYRKVKELSPDYSIIVIDPQTGDMIGIQQPIIGGTGTVPLDKLMYMAWNVESQNWYGEPLLLNAAEAWQDWNIVNEASRRYNDKVAGSTLILQYQKGESLDQHGNLTPNSEIAEKMLDKIKSSNPVAVEVEAVQYSTGVEKEAQWEMKHLSNPNPTPQFIDSLVHLEKLKARACGWPERSVFEATTAGSRADSTSASAFALRNLETLHKSICCEISNQFIDPLVEANFGPEYKGKIQLVAGPLLDEHRTEMSDIVKELIKLPNVANRVDIEAAFDSLDIPQVEPEMVEAPNNNESEMTNA